MWQILSGKNPAPFQGDITLQRYFEGWFYKLVTKDKKRAISIIPGISTGDELNPSIAFIQINDTDNPSLWKSFNIESFSADKDKLNVTIDKNFFTDRELKLEQVIDGMSVMGKVFFQGIKPYPKTTYAPSIMGPFYYIPNMECNHAVVSISHKLMGYLTINGEIIDFTGGYGYIEKDWGMSFPKSWLWMQGNSFNEKNSSFMVSIAHIPLGKIEFTGIISFFYYKGKVLNISTYNGGKIKEFSAKNNMINLKISNGKYSMDIICNQKDTGLLRSPLKGKMSGTVKESLNSVVNLTITHEKTGDILFKDTSICCGSEIGGNFLEDYQN